MVWVTTGVPRPVVTTYSKVSKESSMVGAVTSWRFSSGSAVEARSVRRLSLWSTSVVEGVVSKEGNGEQGIAGGSMVAK
jgi:hypothetical protein